MSEIELIERLKDELNNNVGSLIAGYGCSIGYIYYDISISNSSIVININCTINKQLGYSQHIEHELLHRLHSKVEEIAHKTLKESTDEFSLLVHITPLKR